jgi:hypothetical protein
VDLKKYTSFFHDGSIVAIYHVRKKITLTMESAEMDAEDIKDDIILSKDDRIRGRLHIEGVKIVKENGQIYSDFLKMKCKDAEIFHFEIGRNKVEIQIKWFSYPSNPCIENFSIIEIDAEKIYWENIPDFSGSRGLKVDA